METNTTPYTIFKTILSYSVFILASPIITFFVSKIIFEGILGTSPVTTNISSAVLAVVVLHIAVGMYILKAYSEADKVKDQ
ncbi:vacuolar ATPase assembly integral membrane protein VMA21 homolog [Diorhabda carinulata]|uniref:vacuolar ATPase assembly integral membrane protein VMA21 homolog n=1 Tax=Diorhabda sublineata TaxID=1163346 RepID=UPI0024E052CF|nr:vacuolar ATPase assembly integral membrane protein VMA21 homolog [Diorhabda sublineata]XP_057659882.1 vacuolar ATPase assembly integral membrane protein VMA21 homolog [Diorhabda carinulata]